MTHLERTFWLFVGCVAGCIAGFPAGAKYQAGMDWDSCWRYYEGESLMNKTAKCVPVLTKELK